METYITSHIGIILLILLIHSSKLRYNLYQYSGARLAVEKFFPRTKGEEDDPNYRKPSSFVPWFLSIYIVLFGIASNRYERATSSYEMQVATFQTQMASESRSIACANLHNIQKNKVPHKPDLFLIWNTLASLFTEEKYEVGQDMLIKTIETYKMNLNNCTLEYTDLSGADLSGAYLYKANLLRADLSEADLSGAYLSGADLSKANFSSLIFLGDIISTTNLTNANFSGADLTRATLRNANLKGANLSGADLYKVDLSKVDLSKTKNLYKTKLPPEIEKELRKTHPQLFEKPDDVIEF